MDNNYDFWDQYLKLVKKEIKKMCLTKEKIHADFHIHSNYSADGKQSINQIIASTKKMGFDIIAITDHDRVDAYNELYDIVKNGLTTPLVVPGIEFTTDNRDYGGQCHMLQLFINPKDKEILNSVKKNSEAMFNRSKIQFKRLKENITIQTILNENKIKISYDEYLKYLKTNNLIPEYDTLCFYLTDKFKAKNIDNFKILDLLEKNNALDCYQDRKKYKRLRYQKLRGKYEQIEKNYYNSRLLLSMLAVREVDDDWWDKPSCGSLSVNSYGQVKINEIDNDYKIFFAHPEEKKLPIVKDIIKNNAKIIGVEKNIRSEYKNIDDLYKLQSELKLLRVTGSDSHDATLEFYSDMDYYLMDSSLLLDIVKKC